MVSVRAVCLAQSCLLSMSTVFWGMEIHALLSHVLTSILKVLGSNPSWIPDFFLWIYFLLSQPKKTKTKHHSVWLAWISHGCYWHSIFAGALCYADDLTIWLHQLMSEKNVGSMRGIYLLTPCLFQHCQNSANTVWFNCELPLQYILYFLWSAFDNAWLSGSLGELPDDELIW